jgi:hypothetical protein
LVSERRQGRHVYYHLRQPELAAWLSEAMNFLEEERAEAEQLRNAIEKTRVAWSTESDATE